MKTNTLISILVTALVCAFGFSVHASLIFTEEYPTTYGEATALGSNQTTGGYNTKWPTGNGTGSGSAISTSAAALSYGPLQAISGSASLGFRATTAGSRDTAATYATQSGDGNAVYCSFLINVTAATPTARTLMGLRNSTGSGTLAVSLALTGGRQLTLSKSGTLAGTDPTVLNVGQTYLVVFAYKFINGSGTDQVAMWVNPTTGGADENTASVTPITGATGSDQNSLLSLRLPSAADVSGPLYLDEIRIGTTWVDVTPSGGPVVGQKLGFTTQPASAAPGATMNPVVVQVQNIGGAAAASNGVPVTLTLTSGSGILSGTLTQNTDANGQAIFSDLSIDTAGSGKQLTATASGIGAGLTAAVSANFTIVAPVVGTKLGFSAQPVNGVINTTLNTIVVQIQEPGGAAVASNGVPITLTLTSGIGFVSGTLTQNTDNTGKATFNGLSIDTDGVGKEFTASASGSGAGLADAVSNPFTITLTPVGAKLGFTTQPSSAAVNATMNSIVVQIRDLNSAAVASNGVPVTLTLTLGSGVVSGTTTQNTDVDGKATFSDLSINTAGLAKQFTASASGSGAGLASAPSSIFAITVPTVTSPPVITQAVMSVSGFILRGTNGAPSGEYRVLNGTNANQPMAQWTSVLTNTFNAGGNFDCTNSVVPATSQGFYRLVTSGSALPDFGHYGYGTVGSGVTGGAAGATVVVSNYVQLGDAISNTAPLTIEVVGTIYMRTNGNFYVRANKTLIGQGTNATLIGDLGIFGSLGSGIGASNVIVRNLTISNPDAFGEDDGITIKFGAHHIWVDHCTFVDCADGNLDITRESDFVTVSWCKFFYTAPNGHENVNLIGGNDDDTSDLGKLHVTFHHNWWGALAKERMPSVRFGRVHVYNNYFNSPGNNYCTRARLFSEVLVENNYYDNVFNPWELATSNGNLNGKLRASGNITNNCIFSTTHYSANLPNGGVVLLVPGTDTMSSGVNELGQIPFPYVYTLDPALSVPTLVQTHAGAGAGPFAP